jgi:hypothetical protein
MILAEVVHVELDPERASLQKGKTGKQPAQQA